MNLPHQRFYALALALVRIFTGLFWLSHGIPKFTDAASFMPPNGAMGQFLAKTIAGTVGPYHEFLVHTVQPNAGVFAELVRLGEVVAGCLLVFGLFTRLGGAIGVALGLNYLAAKGMMATVEGWNGLDGVSVVLSAISLILPTGRFLGVDWLLTRRRRTPIVTPTPVRATPQAQPYVVSDSTPESQPIHAEFVDEPPTDQNH